MQENMSKDQLHVLWITNVMAPYRIPVWESLGTQAQLQVVLVEGDDTTALLAVRNSAWRTRQGTNFSAENIRSFKFRRGGAVFHMTGEIRKIISLVRNCDVLLAGAWESPIYWQFMIAAKLFHRPIVLFHESTDKSGRFRHGTIYRVKSWMFRKMNAIVVPGVSSRKSVERLGVSVCNIFQGFNSVDMKHFIRTQSSSINYKPNLSSKLIGHHYIYVGQLINRKRVELIVEEFDRVRRSADTLSIVGKGDQMLDLQSLVRQLQLDAVVSFKGEVTYEALPSVLHQHHTLVLASEVEVWGLVVNEALAAGLHVVVSDACGVAESVTGMNGVYTWNENQGSLGVLMHQSADDWRGPIMEPEILQFTGEKFAAQFMDAFRRVSKSA